MLLLQSQPFHEGSVVYFHLGAYCNPEMHCHHTCHGCMVLSIFRLVAENYNLYNHFFTVRTQYGVFHSLPGGCISASVFQNTLCLMQ